MKIYDHIGVWEGLVTKEFCKRVIDSFEHFYALKYVKKDISEGLEQGSTNEGKNQFKNRNDDSIKVIKFTDNKGMVIEIFESSSLAGKNTSILVAMQSMKAQAMAKVLVEEGEDDQHNIKTYLISEIKTKWDQIIRLLFYC